MSERTALRGAARVACALVLIALGSVAGAALVIPTDFDGITLGASVNNPGPVTLTSPQVGQLDMEVFHNTGTGVYTYQIEALPDAATGDNVTHLITPLNLYGFNGVAGWSYSDAVAAGGPGDATAWSVDFSLNDQLTWNNSAQEGGSNFLDGGESLRFFYQSTHAPINSGLYVMGGGGTSGSAFSQPRPQQTPPPDPISEPVGLGLVGLAMLGLGRKRN